VKEVSNPVIQPPLLL